MSNRSTADRPSCRCDTEPSHRLVRIPDIAIVRNVLPTSVGIQILRTGVIAICVAIGIRIANHVIPIAVPAVPIVAIRSRGILYCADSASPRTVAISPRELLCCLAESRSALHLCARSQLCRRQDAPRHGIRRHDARDGRKRSEYQSRAQLHCLSKRCKSAMPSPS